MWHSTYPGDPRSNSRLSNKFGIDLSSHKRYTDGLFSSQTSSAIDRLEGLHRVYFCWFSWEALNWECSSNCLGTQASFGADQLWEAHVWYVHSIYSYRYYVLRWRKFSGCFRKLGSASSKHAAGVPAASHITQKTWPLRWQGSRPRFAADNLVWCHWCPESWGNNRTQPAKVGTHEGIEHCTRLETGRNRCELAFAQIKQRNGCCCTRSRRNGKTSIWMTTWRTIWTSVQESHHWKKYHQNSFRQHRYWWG